MKPELYDEVQLICSVPSAELEVGDRAVLIDYLEHPDGGEVGAVLELSQSLEREQYVVTVPVGAISAKGCGEIAASAQVTCAIEEKQEALVNRPFWLLLLQRVLNVFDRLRPS